MGCKRRTTCLSCENAGRDTLLRPTYRGNLCPLCDAGFIANLEHNARLILGFTAPKLIGKGVPSRSRS